MKEIIQQLINQIEADGKFSENTKSSYKSDLNELINYCENINATIKDVNQTWVRNYLKYLEQINKEKSSYNRRASTFRLFLKFLYQNRFAPTNYSLIVSNINIFEKQKESELKKEDVEQILDKDTLPLWQRIILLFIGKIGLTATQIASFKIHQVDFEKKIIKYSDAEELQLDENIFSLLRKYLLDERNKIPNSDKTLYLFLNDDGKAISEDDIYNLIKQLSIDLNLQGKLTTRNLRKTIENKQNILSIQKDVLNVISTSRFEY